MVDISDKAAVARRATARGRLRLRPTTAAAIASGEVPKGDPFSTGRIAAIQAVKATPAILPLCHPLPIGGVEVDFTLEGNEVACRVTVAAMYRTGVEMEALTGVMAGLLCVWDLVKSLEKDAAGQYPETRIHDVEVVEKLKGET
ncbi:MAG: molybdenum cofactor biosynthesis protein C [Marine Group III euryarchaeote CG-Bathy2]|uniref:Molybdenum cofactor biosynthesis subunit (MoaC) n=2 Tax=Methanobacteriati TaxID=3366610 RepID=A0A075H8E8_9EURY|nr:molybdenum cofactor biosynthesis subunit (moaC) [uncultured marine group II/III euryarchaeote KM3_43_F08]OIR09875.1 MAG: molybdenum cofactor biosynthesis protein C [Marine Group III euryarchaeote CG-Bathy2]